MLAELIIRREGPVGRILFSNPAKFNAMSIDMWRDLPGRIAAFDQDAAIRVIVLEGEGEKAFVSGADISQFEKQREQAGPRDAYNQAVEAAYLAPIACSKPVVAKIRGVCMGGGLGLAASCDVRICATDAKFRMPAARLGLGYNTPGVRRFMQILGVQNTLDIFFSARIFGADDALRMGFVMQAVAPEALEETTGTWVQAVAENAPLTLRALKRTVNTMLHDPAERDLDAIEAALKACFDSEDYREGARAFMEKRRPQFQGR